MLIRIAKKVLPVLVTVLGLCMMLYPWISNWYNQRQVNNSQVAYEDQVEETDKETIDKMWKEAKAYNKELASSQVTLSDPFAEEVNEGTKEYSSLLNLNGDGVMGYLEIPCIGVDLPVYHGTDSDVLEKGAGHLQGSSLPVGGKNTHSVITGHTGLTNAKLFTDLTEMKEGDFFFIKVLGRTLAYKVSDIRVVLPDEIDSLYVQDGKDLVTLVTCTPYGVNTHRLFVTGERTDYDPDDYNKEKENGGAPTDSAWMRAYRKAVIIGVAASLILLLIIHMIRKKRDA